MSRSQSLVEQTDRGCSTNGRHHQDMTETITTLDRNHHTHTSSSLCVCVCVTSRLITTWSTKHITRHTVYRTAS